MHKVLTLLKIKHGTPETRLNLRSIYLSRLEQMQVELTDEHMETHGISSGSYEFCTKSGMTLFYYVSKSDPLPNITVKNIKKSQHAKSSKITIFRAGSGPTMFTLTKHLSHQV